MLAKIAGFYQKIKYLYHSKRRYRANCSLGMRWEGENLVDPTPDRRLAGVGVTLRGGRQRLSKSDFSAFPAGPANFAQSPKAPVPITGDGPCDLRSIVHPTTQAH
jgi:hypothetical protein